MKTPNKSRETIDKDLSRFLKSGGGDVVVDWRAIREVDPLQKRQVSTSYERVIEQLLKLNILSLTSNDNFALTGFGLSYNPRVNGSELFFSRQKDAVEYREAYYHKSTKVVIGRYDAEGRFSRLESV